MKLQKFYDLSGKLNRIDDFINFFKAENNNLSGVEALNFANNNLVFSKDLEFISEKISLLENLKFLDFSNNIIDEQFVDFFLNNLPQPENLKILYLLKNQNIKKIPKSIFRFTKLKELSLARCRISEVPDEIMKLTELQVLFLDNNEINIISEKIRNLKKLSAVTLFYNPCLNRPEIDMRHELDFVGFGRIDKYFENMLINRFRKSFDDNIAEKNIEVAYKEALKIYEIFLIYELRYRKIQKKFELTDSTYKLFLWYVNSFDLNMLQQLYKKLNRRKKITEIPEIYTFTNKKPAQEMKRELKIRLGIEGKNVQEHVLIESCKWYFYLFHI